jgi:dTDP-4-amino-4,6-dideoxygalactose transaminase
MNWKIPLADLDYGPEEDAAVLDVLHSKWLTMGGVTQAFEAEFAAYHGSPHAVAVSNATVALHLALLALGVGPGDEVIVPSLSFVATANCVLYTGAEVRFADILSPPRADHRPGFGRGPDHPAHQSRDLHALRRLPLPPARAGCPVRPARAVSGRRRRTSPGAWLDGRALGTWGSIGCFSFFSNKNLSTGEGGMLLTADPSWLSACACCARTA